MQQPDAHSQRVGPFDEELPLLGEEQAEAREVHLLCVDFGLGEVGIDRQVGGQCRRGLPLQIVDAHLGDATRVRRRRHRVQRLGTGQQVRPDTQAFGLPDIAEAGQLSGL